LRSSDTKKVELLPTPIRRRLDAKLERLRDLRPFDREQVARLRKQLEIEMTYNSNAVAGNSLTLQDTRMVLEEGRTISGKPLRDHLEARDHQQALAYLFHVVSRKNLAMSDLFVRLMHQVVTRETEGERAGVYRTGPAGIVGTDLIPPSATDIPQLIKDMLDWLPREVRHLHVVELAALFHHRLIDIRPFFNANRRTARLLMNALLLHAGYPLTIILKHDQKKYDRVLDQADRGTAGPLVLFIAQAAERSLDLYLATFDKDGADQVLPLSEASKGSPYSLEYLSLLARRGALGAHKRGRIWYTTKAAIDEYRRNRRRQREPRSGGNGTADAVQRPCLHRPAPGASAVADRP